MKNAPHGVAARDADREALRAGASAPFRIVEPRRVAYGSKVCEFTIETAIGSIEADLFAPEGREPFVQARSVRDKFTGQWRRTIALDRAFAARVLNALRAQPRQPEEKYVEREPRRAEPSAALLESERRFDDAFADLDGRDGAM